MYIPQMGPGQGRFVTEWTGGYNVRLEWAQDSERGCRSAWARVRDFEQSTLCRAFALDDATYHFDLPNSLRNINTGSTRNGGESRNHKAGFMFRGDNTSPVAKLTLVTESDKFSGYDPTDRQQWENLSRS